MALSGHEARRASFFLFFPLLNCRPRKLYVTLTSTFQSNHVINAIISSVLPPGRSASILHFAVYGRVYGIFRKKNRTICLYVEAGKKGGWGSRARGVFREYLRPSDYSPTTPAPD